MSITSPSASTTGHADPTARPHHSPRSIILRALEPSDADLLYDVENDEAAWPSSDNIAPYSRHALREYALTHEADPFAAGQLRLVAQVGDTQPGGTSAEQNHHRAVGLLDFYDISAIHSHAWIGIYVLPDMRGEGYGHDMLLRSLDYARRHLGLTSVGARILEGNDPSMRLFRKCGFELRGTLPCWRFADGEMRDMHLLTRRL